MSITSKATAEINDASKHKQVSSSMDEESSYKFNSSLLVSGYIHEINELLNTDIPKEIYQLCINYYSRSKRIFIKYYGRTTFQFAIFNPKSRYLSKKINIKLPPGHTIGTHALCFIPNLSKQLTNLPIQVTKALDMDFQHKQYDGFLGIIQKKHGHARCACGHGQRYKNYLAFIFYESTFIYNPQHPSDINGTLLISSAESQVKGARYLKIFSSADSSMITAKTFTSYSDGDDVLYTLNLHDIDSGAFDFELDKIETMDEMELPSIGRDESGDLSVPETWRTTECPAKELESVEFGNIKYYMEQWKCSDGENLACIAPRTCSWSSHRSVSYATQTPMIYDHKMGKIYTTWADKLVLSDDCFWFDENNSNLLYWCFEVHNKLNIYRLDMRKEYKWKPVYCLDFGDDKVSTTFD